MIHLREYLYSFQMKVIETLEIIVPVFNEEIVILETLKRLENLIYENINTLSIKV